MAGDAGPALVAALRSGDHVWCAEGAGEPAALTEAVLAGCCGVDVTLVMGLRAHRSKAGRSSGSVRVLAVGGFGETHRLFSSYDSEVLPVSVAHVPSLIRTGVLTVDAVLVQVGPGADTKSYNLGVQVGYLRPAIEQARTVVAQVNRCMPETYGDTLVPGSRVDAVVHEDGPLPEVALPAPSDVLLAIAQQLGAVVPDGATLQIGYGATSRGAVAYLEPRRRLRIHSGIIGDEVVRLAEAGSLDAASDDDLPLIVTGSVLGTRAVYDFVHRNPRVRLWGSESIHAASALGRIGHLVTVNTAVEVDLSAQVNAEIAAGRYIGAVGGAPDFFRATRRVTSGASVVVLPSTTRDGCSRIVPRVSTVTVPRHDVDFVITEHGIADLRGRSLAARARALVAVAHPDFRAELAEVAACRRARGPPGRRHDHRWQIPPEGTTRLRLSRAVTVHLEGAVIG